MRRMHLGRGVGALILLVALLPASTLVGGARAPVEYGFVEVVTDGPAISPGQVRGPKAEQSPAKGSGRVLSLERPRGRSRPWGPASPDARSDGRSERPAAGDYHELSPIQEPNRFVQAPAPKPPAPPMPKPAAPMPPMPPIPSPTAPIPTPAAPRIQIRLTDFLNPTTAAAQTNVGAPTASISPAASAGGPAATTAQALQQAPSVNLRRTSALNLDPRVRGFHSSQLNASANGFSLYKTRVDIDSLFSQIDSGIVRNLTVIDGPYTSLYGPGFAFLVAELTPSPRYQNGCEMHGQTTLSHATNGRAIYTRQNVSAGGPQWGLFASYGYRTGNDYQPGDDSFDFRVPASYRQWDGFLTAGLDMSRTSRLEFNYLRTEKNDVELPGVVYDIADAKDDEISLRYVIQEDLEDVEQVVVQTWYSRAPYHGDASRAAKQQTFYVPYITNRFRGFPPPFELSNLANTIAQGSLQTAGLRGLLTWGEEETPRLTIGADWRRQEQFYRESHVNFRGEPFQVIFGDNVFGIPKSSLEDFGLLVNYVNPLRENVTVTIGGRLDHTKAFVGLDEVNRGGSPTGQTAGFGRPNEILSMAYGTAKVDLSDTVAVDAGVAYAMRGPNLAELYSDNPFVPLVRQGNSIILGDSELTPERNWEVDLGLSGDWERFDAGLRVFHSSIQNYILYSFESFAGSTAGLDPLASRSYEYTNIDRATIWGGSLLGEHEVRRGLAITGTLSYVKGTNHSPSPVSINPATGLVILDANGNAVRLPKSSESLPNMPPLTGTVGIRWFDPDQDRWSLGLYLRMVNEQTWIADSLVESATPDFSVLGMSGHLRVGQRTRITSAIENVSDRTYTEHGSLVIVNPAGTQSFVKEPGINWRLGVEVDY